MKLVDKLLFAYSIILTAILLISALTQLNSSTKVIAIILFLPVTGFMLFQGVKELYRLKYGIKVAKDTKTETELTHILKKHGAQLPKSDSKSISAFFHQNSRQFLMTIALFSICIAGTITKFAIQNQVQAISSEFVSPLPSTIANQLP